MNEADLFSPSKVRAFLEMHGVSPKKSLGQNFLIDRNNVRGIIKISDLKKTDTVIEVGAGIGTLTAGLAKRARRVIAYEIDKRLIPLLNEIVGADNEEKNNVVVRNRDIMRDLEKGTRALLKGGRADSKDYVVVGNLPYYLGARIIRGFLSLDKRPRRLILVLQKEVAERICARPPQMSILAVSVQCYGKPRIISKLSKNCFFPCPRVDSAVLLIDCAFGTPPFGKDAAPKATGNSFFRLVRAGFANKRKVLINNLSYEYPISKEILTTLLQRAHIDKGARAQELSVEDWRSLWYTIDTYAQRKTP